MHWQERYRATNASGLNGRGNLILGSLEFVPAIAGRRGAERRRTGGLCAAVCTLLMLAGAGGLLRAAGPPGDLCTNATLIPGSGPFPYFTPVLSIAGTTTSGDPAFSCDTADNSTVVNSLWYRFTPTRTAVYTLSTCSDAPTATTVGDTVMAIFTSANACLGPFDQLTSSCLRESCGDDSCGPGYLQAAITTRLAVDRDYFILVWRFDNGAPPDPNHAAVQLRVDESVQPPNDLCADAISLSLDLPLVGTTAGASNDYYLASSACLASGSGNAASPAEGPDVVYAFTAPADGAYSFKVANYSIARTNDLVLYLVGSCPSGPVPVGVDSCLAAANRNSASRAEEICGVTLAAGQTVYLIVDDTGCMPGSAFTVSVVRYSAESEPNDTPATANPVRCETTGFIEQAGDLDWFSLGAPAAGSRLFALVDGEAADYARFDLRVTTATDTLEFDDQNNDEIFGRLSPNIAGTPLTGAEAFLQVSGPQGGPYRLYAAVQPPLASAFPESEPNDSVADANFSDAGYFVGALSGPAPSLDQDVFGFSANAGELIFLSLDSDPLRDNTPINAKLELLDASGNVLMIVNDDVNFDFPCLGVLSNTNSEPGSLLATRPYSPAEGLVYRTPDDGTFFARVSIGTACTLSRGAGDYLLSISKNCPICCVPARFIGLSKTNGQVRMQLRGAPFTTYSIEACSDLRSWSPKTARTAGADGLFEFQEAVQANSSVFYRAVAP